MMRVGQNPRMDDDRELIMTCSTCHEPIADHQGYLWVSRAAVNDHVQASREWTKEREEEPGGAVSFPITDIFDHPKPVRWRGHHKNCDPDPDADAYTIESERLSTWADLAHWTAHLMEKSWLSATDWRKLLEGAAEGNGPRLRPVVRSPLHA